MTDIISGLVHFALLYAFVALTMRVLKELLK